MRSHPPTVGYGSSPHSGMVPSPLQCICLRPWACFRGARERRRRNQERTRSRRDHSALIEKFCLTLVERIVVILNKIRNHAQESLVDERSRRPILPRNRSHAHHSRLPPMTTWLDLTTSTSFHPPPTGILRVELNLAQALCEAIRRSSFASTKRRPADSALARSEFERVVEFQQPVPPVTGKVELNVERRDLRPSGGMEIFARGDILIMCGMTWRGRSRGTIPPRTCLRWRGVASRRMKFRAPRRVRRHAPW